MRGSRSYVGLYQAQINIEGHAADAAGGARPSTATNSPPPSPPRPHRRRKMAPSPPPSPSPEPLPLAAKPPRRPTRPGSSSVQRKCPPADRGVSKPRVLCAPAARGLQRGRIHPRAIAAPQPLRLSEVLRQRGGVWDPSGEKLHAASKGITRVDRVPTVFRAARVLFLSGNCLDDRAE